MILEDKKLEQQALATIIMDGAAAKKFIPQLRAEDFTSEPMADLFEVLQHMSDQNMKLEIPIIASIAKDQNRRVSMSHLADVMFESTPDIETTVRILKDLSGRRGLQGILTDVLMDFENKNFIELKKKLTDGLANLDTGLSLKPYKSNREIVEAMEDRIKKIQAGELEIKGLTGIKKVDDVVTIEEGDFVTIGAGSGVGKSWLANTISCHQSQRYGSKVLVFSMEMVDTQWAARTMSYFSGVSSMDIRKAHVDLDGGMFQHAKNEFINSTITICDKPFLSFDDVKNISTVHSMDYGLDMIIVDHGLLMKLDKAKGMNYSDKIGMVTSGLKSLAKDLKMTVVMLWQLTKDQIRAGEMPNLSKLKSSGSIIQDSDAILMLYRPEQAGIEVAEIDGLFYEDLTGLAVIDVQKNRNGLEGHQIPATFNADAGGFTDRAEEFRTGPVVKPDPSNNQARTDTLEDEIKF